MSKLTIALLAALSAAPVIAAEARKVEPQPQVTQPLINITGMEGMQSSMMTEAEKLRQQKAKVLKPEDDKAAEKPVEVPEGKK